MSRSINRSIGELVIVLVRDIFNFYIIWSLFSEILRIIVSKNTSTLDFIRDFESIKLSQYKWTLKNAFIKKYEDMEDGIN